MGEYVAASFYLGPLLPKGVGPFFLSADDDEPAPYSPTACHAVPARLGGECDLYPMKSWTDPSASPTPTRAGYISLVGRPNAGKSTLMNRLLGRKLSIVTPKPQTTWQRVTGIRTTENAQAIFLDTPGLLLPKDLLQRCMLSEALEALREGDVVVLLIDSTASLEEAERKSVVEAISLTSAPVFVVLNKIDEAAPDEIATLSKWAGSDLGQDVRGISGLHGYGVEELWTDLVETLPVAPFLYPDDDISAESVRYFAAEFIRETVFEQFREEIPYSVFATIEEFREDQDPVYIQANVFVERNSQKRILVGDKGRAIRELGRAAREKIQDLVDRPVYLDVWVKVLANWRRRRADLRRLGFRVPVGNDESR